MSLSLSHLSFSPERTIRFDFETSTTGIAAISVASPPPSSRPSSPTPPPSRSISEALDILFSGAHVRLSTDWQRDIHQPLSKTSSCFASNDQGHWARISEPVRGRLLYKPPIYDINAPDLYIPFMAFGTYVVLAGLSLELNGKSSYWYFVAEV
ncbi:uncharacterized protein LOC117132628 [Brassica rapa]|uniref:uncharacterized protein LOC106442554 n=1 Tax=Brassica napus TaxID=3708 RepID=UPI0006AB51A6|nr:uncharacterized protein LOC106442554 [Brassica napus]XP_033143280.1 uncharacterized protein LOC117132628 [Brassica rapa]